MLEDFNHPSQCHAGPWVTEFRCNPVFYLFPFSFNKHVGDGSSVFRWSGKEVQRISCLQLLHLFLSGNTEAVLSHPANKGISCPGRIRAGWSPGVSPAPPSPQLSGLWAGSVLGLLGWVALLGGFQGDSLSTPTLTLMQRWSHSTLCVVQALEKDAEGRGWAVRRRPLPTTHA